MDLKCCGWCCGIFSLFSFVFLIVVDVVLKSGSRAIKVAKDPHEAGNTALNGAFVYIGFLGLSVACCVAARYRESREANKRHLDLEQGL